MSKQRNMEPEKWMIKGELLFSAVTESAKNRFLKSKLCQILFGKSKKNDKKSDKKTNSGT